METTQTNNEAAERAVGCDGGLAGLLARWSELAPAEVRMFHPEEVKHFGGEIGCITTNEHGCVHHIAGPPDDDDRAMLLQTDGRYLAPAREADGASRNAQQQLLEYYTNLGTSALWVPERA